MKEKNDSVGFANAVDGAIQYGLLHEGDFLVMDNAAIHVGANSYLSERMYEEHDSVIQFV